jgi:hypothetical protein
MISVMYQTVEDLRPIAEAIIASGHPRYKVAYDMYVDCLQMRHPDNGSQVFPSEAAAFVGSVLCMSVVEVMLSGRPCVVAE